MAGGDNYIALPVEARRSGKMRFACDMARNTVPVVKKPAIETRAEAMS